MAGCLVRFYYHGFIEIPVSNAKSVDPDQTSRSVASALSTLFANIPFTGR